jgi:hypothetical protein
MTTCATETAAETVRRAGFTTSADGSYAACLTAIGDDDSWYPERWTLDGPEPYTVPLPGNQPEDPGSQLVPLTDGRVLIRRRVADRHDFALLYPTGPGTGELPLGSLRGEDVRLLPPPGTGDGVLALAYDGTATAVWLVHSTADGAGGGSGGDWPRKLAEIPGHCYGGAWLDRTGRMLALDREAESGGPVKTVAVDLRRGGEISPLLQITEDSDDRLLLAEPDSGLLVVRSNAPGEDRLGWGVLGNRDPVRFPEALRLPDSFLTPFAAQPGQIIAPEACGIALTAEGPHGTSLAIWRPGQRQALWLTGPQGWLPGAGLWTAGGVLRLPYACAHCPCGIVAYDAPAAEPEPLPVPVLPDEPRPSAVLPLQKAPLAAAGPVPAGS